MGLDATACKFLAACLPAKTALSLGYPDILLDNAEARELFGVRLNGIHPQNDEAKKRHNFPRDLVDTDELFRALGIVLTCVDYKVLRGNEVVADMNEPCDLGEFDIVIDPGTLEHCFNLPQAAMNVATSVKVGGHVVHMNPISCVNHGFYMLSPTWYADWYGQNGFELKRLWISDGKSVGDIDLTARVLVKNECWIYALAQKRESKALKWPIQTKYLLMQGA
jgi:hypothetical protein